MFITNKIYDANYFIIFLKKKFFKYKFFEV